MPATLYFGEGYDGSATISSDTDLLADNIKHYTNLTIDAAKVLSGNSPLLIFVSGTLTLNGTIEVNPDTLNVSGEAGGSGDLGGDGGAGGTGGGLLIIQAATITGTGTIRALGGAGVAGGNGGTAVSPTNGAFGTAGKASAIAGTTMTAPVRGDQGVAAGGGGNSASGGLSVGEKLKLIGEHLRNSRVNLVLLGASYSEEMDTSWLRSGSGSGGGEGGEHNTTGGGGASGGGGGGFGAAGGASGAGGTSSGGGTGTGGGGGGGGGSGGLVVIGYTTGSAFVIDISGGDGGAGGDANNGVGGAGSGGGGGSTGMGFIWADASSATVTATAGAAGAAGTTGQAAAASSAGDARKFVIRRPL